MKESKNIQVRYITCFVIWLTLFTFYSMRSNMSIALLAMNKPRTVSDTFSYSSCIKNISTSHESIQKYDFEWNESEKGYILASFFVGYFSTHLLGSILSLLYGPRNIMAICLVGATIFTILKIYLPYYGVWYFVFGRIMIGVFSGPLYPIVHELIASYSPISERTILTAVTHSGNILGLSFTFGIGGYIVENVQDGWKYLFLINGLLGVLTLVLWMLFVYSNPKDHPLMCDEEKKLIAGDNWKTNESCDSIKLKDIPFMNIFTSKEIYLVCLSQFGNSIILYAQLTGHPKYLNDVFGISKSTASYLSIIPFIANFIFQLIYPFLVDYEKFRNRISKSTHRRINSALGCFGSSAFLVSVAFVSCDNMRLSIILVSLSMVCLAANQCGYFTAMIDLSPKYSGIIMGIASMFGSLSGVIQPQVSSYLIKEGDLKKGYSLVFMVTSAASLLMGLPFVFYGKSEELSLNSYVKFSKSGNQ